MLQFLNKWQDYKFKIVSLEQLIILKRDNCIRLDRYEYYYSYRYLAKKYNLSFMTIKNILKSTKEEIYVNDIFKITLL